MPYELGPKSLAELKGVHPKLVECVQFAIGISQMDFAVHDGLRTVQEQREYVRRGVSQTMNSKHMVQRDGYGHAVDLVPYINGKLRWEWPPIYLIAAAMWHAAKRQKIQLRWGACWDKRFPYDFRAGTVGEMKYQTEQYVNRRRAAGRAAFIDGPHFELLE